MDENTMEYDALVVGGGPAGLNGALTLARSRRRVLLVDAGRPRNARAEGIHNFAAAEGITPREYARRGRAEAAGYGAEVRDGSVVAAGPVDGGFAATLEDGTQVTARRLLVTSGVVDELPEVEGLADRWGHDVLHCPYCHGYEVRDQAVGVLASSPMAMHQVMLFRQLTEDLTLFLNDAFEPGPDELAQLAARDVTVVPGRVAAVVVQDGALTGVRLADGEVVARQALVVQVRSDARSELIASLGLRTAVLEVNGVELGEHLEVDAMGHTSVEGVYAAGNVTDLSAQVGGSAAAGTKAGALLNAELAAEDTARAVVARRAVG
jgi:thioredoxin reductase